ATLHADEPAGGPAVIVLASGPSPGERVQALERGADVCLARPLDPEELAAQVGALLRRGGVDRRAPRGIAPASLAVDLDRLLASVDDLFFVLDRDWHYRYVNDATARSVGLAREAMIGRPLWELLPQAVGGAFEQAVRQALA